MRPQKKIHIQRLARQGSSHKSRSLGAGDDPPGGEEEAGGEDEEEQGAGNTPAAGLPKGTKSGKMRRAREANTAARRARVSTVGMGVLRR